MNYFTRQEMEGSVRYSGKCRIGNWNENDTLDEVRAPTRRRVAKNQIRPAPSRVPSRTPVARALDREVKASRPKQNRDADGAWVTASYGGARKGGGIEGE